MAGVVLGLRFDVGTRWNLGRTYEIESWVDLSMTYIKPTKTYTVHAEVTALEL